MPVLLSNLAPLKRRYKNSPAVTVTVNLNCSSSFSLRRSRSRFLLRQRKIVHSGILASAVAASSSGPRLAVGGVRGQVGPVDAARH